MDNRVPKCEFCPVQLGEDIISQHTSPVLVSVAVGATRLLYVVIASWTEICGCINFICTQYYTTALEGYGVRY